VTEEASLYITEEFEGGLTLLNCAEWSAAEEASPHHPEPVTSGFTPSGVTDAEIEISDGFEICSTVVASRPLTVVKETGVSRQFGSTAEEASLDSTEAITDETVFSDLKDVEYGHLMAVFTLSICGRAILVICWNSSCLSLGV
jgi:hypothetical protein